MEEITIRPADPARTDRWIQAYSLSVGLVDTYWLYQITTGALWEILLDGKAAGFCSMQADEQALTGLYLPDPFGRQAIFRKLRQELRPALAYVVTNDEPLLALALDDAARVETHGYFFRDSGVPSAPPAYPLEQIRPAEETDLPDLIRTGFYHPAIVGDPENPIYVLRDAAGAFLGTGHIALWMRKAGRDWGAVGMYTAPAHRGKGAGRSIIAAMKELTYRMGLAPIAGCFHTNLASKATLESCSFLPEARYLKIYF